MLLLVGFASPLTLLSLVDSPKDSKLNALIPLYFPITLSLTFLYNNLYAWIFLEHHHSGPQILSGVPISTRAFGAKILWSEVTWRTGNIYLMFYNRWT